jgi:hypothetical protein
MQESDLRAYALESGDANWQYPKGRDIFSHFTNGDYVCLTYKGINFWHEGKLELSIEHDAETQARYESLLQRQPKGA